VANIQPISMQVLKESKMANVEFVAAKANERPTAKATVAEDACRKLRTEILQGTLLPGQKLKFEILQQELEVSASSLREALTRLTSEGLVSSEPRRGFSVAPVSLEELKDITRLRVILEPLALRDAIEHGDDAWEAEILATWHRFSKIDVSHGDAPGIRDEQFSYWHRAFHEALIAACTSKKTMQIRAMLFEQSERYRALSAARRTQKRNKSDEHRKLMDAVLAHDADLAEDLMIKHIKMTSDLLIDALESSEEMARE
jgi:DNA-binding GntR family transcriptional regulator